MSNIHIIIESHRNAYVGRTFTIGTVRYTVRDIVTFRGNGPMMVIDTTNGYTRFDDIVWDTDTTETPGTAMQHAIDSDYHTAHIMNGTAWRPAYLSDARIGDTIRYTTQSADFTTTPPTVTDTTHTATITHTERIADVTRPYVAWTDADGVTHRNAPNVHIHIQLTLADI